MREFEFSVITYVILSSILIAGSAGLTQETTPNYYEILELSEDCSQEDVKKAFRRLAKKYHPDKCKDPDAQEKFQKLGEAHEILSDPEKRQDYDNQRKYGGTYRPNTSFNFHNFNFDDLFSDFGDFEDLRRQHRSFGGDRFKVFSDFPDFSDLNFGFRGKPDSRKFGGGDSYFGQHFGGGVFQQQGQAGRGCKTVTQRVGNTITTYTTCN